MMHAYSELYVTDAQYSLADCFDYLINECSMSPAWAECLFLRSGYAELFETGNPCVVAGMSGVELARRIIDAVYQGGKELPEKTFHSSRSPEFWAGWALAAYQWYSARSFCEIFGFVRLREIIEMYPLFHEMDETRFFEAMEERSSAMSTVSRLKRLREYCGLSQTGLAKASGVGIRSIQMYEQGVNDIDKAQAHTLYRLSKALGCSVEELLEQPLRTGTEG